MKKNKISFAFRSLTAVRISSRKCVPCLYFLSSGTEIKTFRDIFHSRGNYRVSTYILFFSSLEDRLLFSFFLFVRFFFTFKKKPILRVTCIYDIFEMVCLNSVYIFATYRCSKLKMYSLFTILLFYFIPSMYLLFLVRFSEGKN